jgi:hypothetical protein
MPIDDMLLSSMTGTFKAMLDQIVQQNISGEHVEKMAKVLQRIDDLGREHSDFNAFNAQVMSENLFARFSEYYTLAITEQQSAVGNSGNAAYNDAELLKNCVNGLAQSIESIKQGYKQAIGEAEKSGNAIEVEVLQNPDIIIQSIRELITLGQSEDMTLPDFLRIQIEKGLDKAMEGVVIQREGLMYERLFAEANPVSPYHILEASEALALFESLCKKSAFGVPESKEWEILRDDIHRKFVPDISKFNKIRSLWEDMLLDLSVWSLSYTSFAPEIFPWAETSRPYEAVKETQNILPGVFWEKAKLLKKYFDLHFLDIFKHPTFLWQVKYHYLSFSQEFLAFVIEGVYPQCKPNNHLPENMIEKRADFHPRGPSKQDREANPESHMPSQRYRELYDKKFGEGLFEKKFGTIPPSQSKAKPWDISLFKYSNQV